MNTITIGPIADRTIPRPGVGDQKKTHLVPDPIHRDYWAYATEYMRERIEFHSPVAIKKTSLNNFFGLFGMCYNPTHETPRSFHLGLDFATSFREDVVPITQGILEYAGYSLANGYYVMLSHPHIVSQDGFVLHSLYTSLHAVDVGFTKYQKMLREISLRTYPEIMIGSDTVIGDVGETGDAAGLHVHMHLQCEFRHADGRIISIDPAMILGMDVGSNITEKIKTIEAFADLYDEYTEDIHDASLESYWGYKDK